MEIGHTRHIWTTGTEWTIREHRPRTVLLPIGAHQTQFARHAAQGRLSRLAQRMYDMNFGTP